MKGNIIMSSYKRKPLMTDSEFKEKVKNLVGNEYTFLEPYKANTFKIKCRHNTCKHEFYTTPYKFLQLKHYCPKCAIKEASIRSANTRRKPNSQFVQEVKDLVGDEYTFLEEYKSNLKPLQIRHNLCNGEYHVRPYDFLKAGQRCPYCYLANKRKAVKENFLRILKEENNNEYKLIGEYANTKTKVKLLHTVCNKTYLVKPNDFQQGHRCPYCATRDSNRHKENGFIQYMKDEYDTKIQVNTRHILSGNKELDVYIPEANVAIEFDGLYWHRYIPDNSRGKNYHLDKTMECEAKGIQLIHIFEDEWDKKKNIVKSKIDHIICADENPVIYARKCYVEEISTTDKNQFLEENHIQGKDQSKIKLGLWYPLNNEEDILVSVMTFCKPRKALGHKNNTEYDYELSRFANNIEYRVIGSFGKLFKYFKNNYDFNSIVTYADRRYSSNIRGETIYEKNGFVLDHISKPNYWYLDYPCNKRFHRYEFRKSKLKEKFPELYSDDKTERQIMEEARYFRIYDCGNLVYVYNKD
jgi:hypothetical protein